MPKSILASRIVSRYVPAGLFIVVGLALTALALVGGISWVLLCFFSLVPIGILWISEPALARVLSVGPLLGIASALTHLLTLRISGPWVMSPLRFAASLAVPFTALIAGVSFLGNRIPRLASLAVASGSLIHIRRSGLHRRPSPPRESLNK
jgi:uncharacterized protein YqfA (UPF0365 family)